MSYKKIDMGKHYAELRKLFDDLNKSSSLENKVFQLTRICKKLFDSLNDETTMSYMGFSKNKADIKNLERKLGYKKAS